MMDTYDHGFIALSTDPKSNRCHCGYVDEALQTLKTQMPDVSVGKARQASLDWRAGKGNDPTKLLISAYKRVMIGTRLPLDAEDANRRVATITRFHRIIRITKASIRCRNSK